MIVFKLSNVFSSSVMTIIVKRNRLTTVMLLAMMVISVDRRTATMQTHQTFLSAITSTFLRVIEPSLAKTLCAIA